MKIWNRQILFLSSFILCTSVFAEGSRGTIDCRVKSNQYEETMHFSAPSRTLSELMKTTDQNGAVLEERNRYVLQAKSVCGISVNPLECLSEEHISDSSYSYRITCGRTATLEVFARKDSTTWNFERICQSVPGAWYKAQYRLDNCTVVFN